ncbi:MAG: ABC transporter substrate-binding protein [Marinobacter sp.]|uniref:substrate-binding periplasmic protein n=1 Tax=Marinobacter sp. TaxID=50741 RepID=UPI00299D2D6F|nr:ABC transporter substrate-binding protein [Marinobacter sp.]MDX1756188.1 ABC transporter substrate-binding protein [Marinobacter sp.]
MRSWICWCWLALLMFPLSVSAEVFRGHCRDRPPMIQPAGIHCVGPAAELIERALAYAGHQVEWVTVPWARTLYMAQRGEVDVLPVHSMDRARETFLLPIHYGNRSREIYYFAKAGSPTRVERFDDLIAYRIGALRGSYYSDEFNTAQGLNVFYSVGPEQLIEMLLHDRLDVVITSTIHDPDLFFSNPRLRKLEYVEHFANKRYFSIPAASPMARYYDDIRQMVELMLKRGEIEDIYRHHGVPVPAMDPPADG